MNTAPAPDLRAPKAHALRLQDLVLWVRLGCTQEERAQPQEVRVCIEFRFTDAPGGALSDALEDTICYADVSNAVLEHCESREYKLIERMGVEIFEVARTLADSAAEVAVSVHKVRPPVERLKGGSWYRCGDFLL